MVTGKKTTTYRYEVANVDGLEHIKFDNANYLFYLVDKQLLMYINMVLMIITNYIH